MKLTVDDVEAILDDVTYPGVEFELHLRGGSMHLQVVGGVESVLKGRKWYVSPWATRSEVVQTAFLAVMTWVEHEAREHFLYRGRAVFGPHFVVEDLVELAKEGRVDGRSDSCGD
jgi:hypothetical protein